MPSVGYRRVQLFLNFKPKENFSSITLNPRSIPSHLHLRIRKNIDIVEQPNTKISCLPRDSLLDRSWNRRNYFHDQIKISKKYKTAITKNSGVKKIICLHSGNLLEALSSFIDLKYTEIAYFSFKRLLTTLILTGHFHFLHFTYFQTPYFRPALRRHLFSNWNS